MPVNFHEINLSPNDSLTGAVTNNSHPVTYSCGCSSKRVYRVKMRTSMKSLYKRYGVQKRECSRCSLKAFRFRFAEDNPSRAHLVSYDSEWRIQEVVAMEKFRKGLEKKAVPLTLPDILGYPVRFLTHGNNLSGTGVCTPNPSFNWLVALKNNRLGTVETNKDTRHLLDALTDRSTKYSSHYEDLFDYSVDHHRWVGDARIHRVDKYDWVQENAWVHLSRVFRSRRVATLYVNDSGYAGVVARAVLEGTWDKLIGELNALVS